jgi:hypothetical protein
MPKKSGSGKKNSQAAQKTEQAPAGINGPDRELD